MSPYQLNAPLCCLSAVRCQAVSARWTTAKQSTDTHYETGAADLGDNSQYEGP